MTEPGNHKIVIPPAALGMGKPRFIAEGVSEIGTATFHLFHPARVNEIISHGDNDYLITDVSPADNPMCPGNCGCRLGTNDADRFECGCDGGCCE